MTLKTKLESGMLHTTNSKIKLLNEKLGIRTVEDFLEYFPRDYEDLSEFKSLKDFVPGLTNVARGVLGPMTSMRTRRGFEVQKAVFSDEEGGQIDCVWFRQKFLKDMFPAGSRVVLAGQIKFENGQRVLMSPQIERADAETRHMGKIVPVYSATEEVSTKWLREKIVYLKSFLSEVKEWMPEEVLVNENLMQRSEAVSELHFPTAQVKLDEAKRRMTFEEILFLQLVAVLRKKSFQASGAAAEIKMQPEMVKKIMGEFGFVPTDAQKIALYQILQDMEKGYPMLRLLQGDVGSGKTFVAAVAAMHAVAAGYQAAFLVPTEILARQHFQKIEEIFKKVLPEKKIRLLIGALPEKEKKEIREGLQKGEIDFVFGTHALFTADTEFKNLAMVVVDEQHRFGVEQRENLKRHGAPHFLAMSATPIPRSLALVLFGETEVSVLDKLPEGRQPIVTKLVLPKKTTQALRFVETELEKGRQAFFVYPLVNDSESEKLQEVKSATEQYKSLKEFYGKFKVGLLHGQMKTEKKKKTMEDFAKGKLDVLVATSVIEVGVDVPNATVMVIEGAERFGLSQLHQFRGRVGRGAEKSYCFLFTSNEEGAQKSRLDALEKTTDGFKLAEIDLQLRGPGEFFGTRQSGMPDLKMASLLDARTIAKARKWAEELIEKNPTLENWEELARMIEEKNLRGE